jgi:NAD(P)H dehydrogenase (quinone)
MRRIDLPYGAGRHAPIAAEDPARPIAAILADPAALIGKTYTLWSTSTISRSIINQK